MATFPWIRSSLLTAAGFPKHGFTMRYGAGASEGIFATWNFSPSTGDSPELVEQNFRALAEHLSVQRSAIRSVHQVHSSRVIAIQHSEAQTSAEKADGLLSWEQGNVVGVKTADCVPVLIADSKSRSVAAVHAGWRGVVGGIASSAVSTLLERHPSANLYVAIGPHICSDCFQVGPEVAAEFPEHHKPDPSAEGKFLVDMAGALRAQLCKDGVAAEQIDITGHCTLCDPKQRFFSHRGHKGQCGRMFNFILAE